MPRAYTLELLPMPNDSQVELERLPATRFAALRFRSLAGKTEVNAKIEELPVTI